MIASYFLPKRLIMLNSPICPECKKSDYVIGDGKIEGEPLLRRLDKGRGIRYSKGKDRRLQNYYCTKCEICFNENQAIKAQRKAEFLRDYNKLEQAYLLNKVRMRKDPNLSVSKPIGIRKLAKRYKISERQAYRYIRKNKNQNDSGIDRPA
jgi:hypothetical protein